MDCSLVRVKLSLTQGRIKEAEKDASSQSAKGSFIVRCLSIISKNERDFFFNVKNQRQAHRLRPRCD